MTLKYLGKDYTPNYLCLSSDITGGGTTLDGVGILGATVLTTDTGEWYFVTAVDTVATYSLPVSATIEGSDIELGAVEIKNSSSDLRATVDANGLHTSSLIRDETGSIMNVSGDGQAWVRAREFGSYGTVLVTFTGLPADGETLTSGDGTNGISLEFDPTDDGVGGGNTAVVFNPAGTIAEFVAILIPIIAAQYIAESVNATVAASGTEAFILTSTVYGEDGFVGCGGTASNMTVGDLENNLDDVTLRTIQETLKPSTSVTQTILINTALASAAFDMSDYIGGMVFVPAVWTAANIGFYVCDTLSGTYVPAKDELGVPIQISTIATGAAGAYFIPEKIRPFKFVKLWSKDTTAATETDNNQAAERSLRVMLK